MENIKNFVEETSKKTISISGKNIKQNERNLLKSDFMKALINDLQENSFDLLDVGMTTDGIALNIQNEEIGSFVITLNATFKSLEYDFDFEVETYSNELKEKEEKKKQKEEEKQKKIKETEEMRAKKKAEKEKKSSEN